MTAKVMLDRDALLRARMREVELPIGCVRIQGLSAAYALSLRGKDLQDDQIFDLISHSLIEPTMTAEEVGKLDLAYIQPLLDAILEFNSLKEGKAESDLKKVPASASPTP